MSGNGRGERPRTRGKIGNQEIADAVSDAVLRKGIRRVADLSAALGVSEVSVRKALNELQRQGVLRRYHGEARGYDGDEIPFRMGIRYAEKRAITARAAHLVEAGDSIFLEAGSAVAMFAERIKDTRGLTVITPNLFIARLFRGSKARVMVTGGLYQQESESMVGPAACAAVRSIGFNKSFIGVSGFTIGSGFMLNDIARAEVTRTILERGAECRAKAWVLTDSSKFGLSHAAVVCSDLSLVVGVVTDPGIPDEYRSYLVAAGVEVLA